MEEGLRPESRINTKSDSAHKKAPDNARAILNLVIALNGIAARVLSADPLCHNSQWNSAMT